ncbi:MAG: prepilin-type N-terminal cleavage/methylation domain-containing protein, partial [Chloroflexota bacterium]|nr:prepilin-type N-terminal cleavage/methylation domain-containing protein [Chloroflexota bacterium]
MMFGRRKGFTLAEILISTAVGMMLLGMAYAGFRTANGIAARGEAQLRVQEKAVNIYYMFKNDYQYMQHTCLFEAHGVSGGTATTDGVEEGVTLTFMKTMKNSSDMVSEGSDERVIDLA